MVVMIIGMVASMAVPRFAQGSRSASAATLEADLIVIRKALILYAAEHGGEFPGPDGKSAADQLTKYSSGSGATSGVLGAAYEFGPYLNSLPPCPVGPNTGSAEILIDDQNSPPVAKTAGGEGWLYNPRTGEFYANVGGVEQGGAVLVDAGG